MAELAERPRDILELKGIYKDFEGLQVLFDINLGVQRAGASCDHRSEWGRQKHAF